MAAQAERLSDTKPRYAEIAVDAQVGPDRTFTYLIPSNATLLPGHAVWVPLLSRQVAGVVFALSDTTDIEGIRAVAGLQDPNPVLAPHQIELARWLSLETQCSLYEAALLMLPYDYRRRLSSYVGLPTERPEPVGEGPALTEQEQRILDVLKQRGTTEQERLLRSVSGPAARALKRLVRAGLVWQEWQWGRPRARPLYAEQLYPNVPEGDAGAAEEALKNAPKQRALLAHLITEGVVDAALARKEFGASAVTGLRKRGLLTVEQERRVRDPLAGQDFMQEAPLTLTSSQATSVSAIEADIAGPDSKTFLLQGPTGSGKTEVYLRALAACIAGGKRGIMLAPEISLTPQLIARLEGRFPGRVGLLHSGLTPGQQYDTWWRIRQGDYDVVLGSRSAIFVPQLDVGLIILDEEHEWTYKQADAVPRYHARAVARKLGEFIGAAVVLGSATPDVGSYYSALRHDYQLLTLPDRVRPGPEMRPLVTDLAEVEVVDMREELKAGVRSIFSRALSNALEDTLRHGQQAILFLNRRGSAGTVQCRDCGHVLRCRRCETPLTYHAEGDRLICHQCGRKHRTVANCPRCRGGRIRFLGLGTQRVVQDVERAFGVQALRWDRDAARGRDAHDEILGRFTRGEAQVLVGTQMVAQGLHLPNVTLVGVMLADLGLHLPDFRAGERAFQLLCQVAGRAGRGADPGRVVVQTYTTENYAIQAGARQDYEAFYDVEIQLRREHHNPPFTRIVRFLFQHTNPGYAEREAHRWGITLSENLQSQGLTEVEVVGPAPAFPARVRGRYRWQVLLRVPPTPAVDMPALLASLAVPPSWTVDVDPVTLV
jgi:primosomal protein N' (replication factor Y)